MRTVTYILFVKFIEVLMKIYCICIQNQMNASIHKLICLATQMTSQQRPQQKLYIVTYYNISWFKRSIDF